jgi:uncharacterized surface protein with fasciclin (FAS1) repeats
MQLPFVHKLTTVLSSLAIISVFISSPVTIAQSTNNIVQTASASKDFSTLVAAVKAADLVDTLSGPGPFTVLAPTNDAFAKVPAAVLEKLLLPANKATLAKILTYHVISGSVDASQIVKLNTAKTVEGSDVAIAVVDGKVKLNAATTVLTTDIKNSNGIIHSIDSVLIPSGVDLTKLVGADSTSSSELVKGSTVRTGGYSPSENSFLGNSLVTYTGLAIIALTILGLAGAFFVAKND